MTPVTESEIIGRADGFPMRSTRTSTEEAAPNRGSTGVPGFDPILGGVLKKRTSGFERTLRELRITEHGIGVGEPRPDLPEILTGTPTWADGAGKTASTATDAADA